MAKDITPTNKSVPVLQQRVSSPPLAPEVAKATTARIKPRFISDATRDENPNASAPDWVEDWRAPDNITPDLIEQCKAALKDWDEFMMPCAIGPIDRQGTRGNWLMQLSMLCASPKVSMQEYMEKTAVYAEGLVYPAVCFSQKALYTAARQFKFVPTFSELSTFMENIVYAHRIMYARIAALANAKPHLTKTEAPKSIYIRDMPEPQRSEYLAEMKSLRQSLESAGIGNTIEAETARREIEAREQRAKDLLKPIMDEKHAAMLRDDA